MSFSNEDLVVRFGAQTGDLKAGATSSAAAVTDAVNKINAGLASLRKQSAETTRGVTSSFSGMGAGVKSQLAPITAAIDGVKGAVFMMQQAFLAGGIVTAIAQVTQITDKYAGLNGRLALVTNSTADLKTAQNELYEIAQRSRVGFDTTIDLYTRLARSTKDSLNPSQKELLTVTEAINKALIVSGAVGESANAALIQLGQGMGSGTLRGDELNSVLEQTPRLAQMIADGMGITVGQLRQLGQEGKLTSKAVFEALKDQAQAVDEEFSKMPVTVGQSMQLIRNAFERVIVDANSTSEATTTLSGAFSDFARWVDTNRDSIVKSVALIMQAFSEMGGVIGTAVTESGGLIGDLANVIASEFAGAVPKHLAEMGNAWQWTTGIISGAALTIKEAIAAVIVVIKQMGNALATVNDVAARSIFFGGQGSPAAAWNEGLQRDAAIQKEYRDKMAALQKDYEKTLARNASSPKGGGAGGNGSGGNGNGNGSGVGKKGGDQSKIAIYEAELNAKRLIAIQKEQHELGVSEEIAYWQSIINTQKVSVKDRQKIESTLGNLRLQQARQDLQNRKAMTAEEISEAESKANDLLAIEEQKARDALSMGIITKAESLRQEMQFEQRRFEIEQAAQQRRIQLAAMDPNNPIQAQKEYDRLLQVIRKHNLNVVKISGEQVKESRRQWTGLFNDIGQGMGNALGGFIVGTQGLFTSLSNLFGSIQSAFANMIGKMLADWIAGNLTMLAQKIGILGSEQAAETAATGAKIASKKAEAAAVIPAEAGMAAGAAASAVAGIPVVGPEMAAAAYASTMGMVLSGLAVASASGGFDIPAGVNPLTQLHQKEMVLPAKYADVIRGMAGSESGNRSSGGAVHFHVNALDRKSVERFFEDQGHSIVKSIKKQSRNFRTK